MAVLEYLLRAPLRALFVVVLAVLAYVCMRAASKLFKAYQEVFVMWSIFFGHSWTPKSKNLRIHPYFCRTDKMDDYSIDECYRFHMMAFAPPPGMDPVTAKQNYKKVFLSYSHAFLCRDRDDGSLRGVTLIAVDRKPTYTVTKLGMMLFHSHYRGGPWAKVLEATLAIRELILHPFTPLYGVAKASTYKPYLVAQLHRKCYPHYAKETPEEIKQIAEEFVGAVSSQDDSYDRDTFVLRRRMGVMQEHVAPISDRDLRNPHIKFYNERNSGWRKGDQLVIVWQITRTDFVNILGIMMKQILYAGKATEGPRGIGGAGNINARRASKIQARRLQRGLTFQDTAATTLAVQYLVYEYGDEEGRHTSEVPLPTPCTPLTPKSAEALTELDINYHL